MRLALKNASAGQARFFTQLEEGEEGGDIWQGSKKNNNDTGYFEQPDDNAGEEMKKNN